MMAYLTLTPYYNLIYNIISGSLSFSKRNLGRLSSTFLHMYGIGLQLFLTLWLIYNIKDFFKQFKEAFILTHIQFSIHVIILENLEPKTWNVPFLRWHTLEVILIFMKYWRVIIINIIKVRWSTSTSPNYKQHIACRRYVDVKLKNTPLSDSSSSYKLLPHPESSIWHLGECEKRQRTVVTWKCQKKRSLITKIQEYHHDEP